MIISKNINKILLFWLTIMVCFIPKYAMSQQYHYVGGYLTGDNVWESDGIPYYVESNLFVTDSASLTILAGTSVLISNNSSIYIKDGTLNIIGNEDNYVNFSPASLLNWKGIHILGNSHISISFTNFTNTENAIEIINNDNVEILNCNFRGVYYDGISIINSNNCKIDNCKFNNVYNAITITIDDTKKGCYNNIISNNKFKGGNRGVTISGGGTFNNNIICDNIFENANVSIYLENFSSEINGCNYINKNVITSTFQGNTEKVGIYLSMDSVFIENNIIWKNKNAIIFKDNINGTIRNNTFYDNLNCFNSISTDKVIDISQNVFLDNKNGIVTYNKSSNSVYNNNNFIINNDIKPLFVNNSGKRIDLSNNYWNTTNDSIINNYIYDSNDDPELAPITIHPLLEDYYIDAPITPPLQVTKQYIDDKVVLSWRANKESDFSNYRIYYGNYKYYSFANMIDNVNDTSLILDISINDTIAVTSIDNNYSDEEGLFSGHESAFAFAEMAPYAGEDTYLCESDMCLYIDNATIPFPYSYISWETSGSGYFIPSDSISTRYYPSNSDYINGSVIITLNVDKYNDNPYKDSFVLTLDKAPNIYAGNDNVIPYGSVIEIKDAQIDYCKSFEWSTLGDGYFEDIYSNNPIYHYGEQDSINSQVRLVLNGYSECDHNSDTVTYLIVNTHNMEGKVYHDNKATPNAVVIAASVRQKIIDKLYFTNTDEDGVFKFKNMFESEYILYALPDTIHKKGIPTYYADNSYWEQAHRIKLNGDAYDIDIHLQNTIENLIKGNGIISGKFEYPDYYFKDTLIYCSSWYQEYTNSNFCVDGLSNITIRLYNSDRSRLIDYTITDNKGNFIFDELPYGSYYLVSEIPRYKTSAPHLLTLSPENEHIGNIIFYIDNSDRITIRNYTNDNNEYDISLYPNPSNKSFNINGIFEKDIYNIGIYNVMGIQVYNENHLLDGCSSVKIDTDNLPNGAYIIKIQNNSNILYINNLIIKH